MSEQAIDPTDSQTEEGTKAEPADFTGVQLLAGAQDADTCSDGVCSV